MKRLLACLLALSVLFGLAACKNKKTVTKEYSDDDDDKKEKLPQMQTFEPITVFDESEYGVTVNGWDGERLSLSFENRSADTTYDFDYEGCSINGLAVPVYLYCDLAPGETDTDTLYLSSKLPEQITDIALTVTVSKSYEVIDRSTVHYYPLGEDAATVYERTPEESDENILTNETLSLVATEYALDRNYFTVELYLTNPTDETVTASFASFTIDGYLISFTHYNTSVTLPANTSAFHTLSISTSEIQNCGIRKLENITCELKLKKGEEEPATHSIAFAPKDLFVPKAENDYEPVAVFEKENCYFAEITNMTTNDKGYVDIQVSMENRSQFYSYQFRLEDVYINAVKASDYFNHTLAPGQKAVKTISLSTPDPEELGEIRHISALFSVTNTESYTADESNLITLYPQGKENMYLYQRKIKVTDYVVLDNEYLTVIAREYKNSYDGGIQVNLFYYNKTEETIYVDWESCKVNGIEKSSYHNFSLMGNSSYFTYESWSKEFLTANNITQINSITVDLHLKESSSYSASSYFSETVELMEKPYTPTTEE